MDLDYEGEKETVQTLKDVEKLVAAMPKLVEPYPKFVKEKMDPDVAAAHQTYSWDQVPPSATAYMYCIKDVGEGMVKPEAGFKPGEGERKLPAKYTGDGDTFTGEMVQKYATEGGKADGKPNGEFWFDFGGARKAAKQVLQDYVHIDEDHAEELLCAKYLGAW